MATLEKLEEELQCAICLYIYTDPKELSCGHIFCSGCLPKLVTDRNSLPCPTCRKITPYPENGVKGLQPPYTIKNLVEILKAKKTDRSVPAPPPLSYCPEHTKQELKLFCETCKMIVCIECNVYGAQHYNHKVIMLEDASNQYKLDIQEALGPMNDQLDALSIALGKFDSNCEQICQQQDNIEAEIKKMAKQLYKAVDARTADLISQLYQCTEAKIRALHSQKHDIETVLLECKQLALSTQETLDTSSDQDIVASRDSIVAKVTSFTNSLQPNDLKPNNTTKLKFTSSDVAATTILKYGAITEFELLPDPSKSYIIYDDEELLKVGQDASVQIKVIGTDDRPYEGEIPLFQCGLVSELAHIKYRTSLERIEGGLYKACFTPVIKGRHRLVIKIDCQHIGGSPLAVLVRDLTVNFSHPLCTIHNVVKPWGVAINQTGDIIVTEAGSHCVSIFSPQGSKQTKKHSFGSKGSGFGQLNEPCGVAVDENGCIFVADSKNHRVQKFSPSGCILQAVGRRALSDLQFNRPGGLAYSPCSKKLYVVDGSSRIIILHSDLSFYRVFGEWGTDRDEFFEPKGIAVDKGGKIYVADYGNSRVVILSSQGTLLQAIGEFKVLSMNKTFDYPVGVAVDSAGVIYVSEYSTNRVSTIAPFTLSIKNFGKYGKGPGEFCHPHGLALDFCGVLYVCDHDNNRIVMY